MTIYEELIQRVSDGETFHIDFEKRTMKIGKQKVIDNGMYDNTKTLIEVDDYIWKTIYELYQNYKFSLPSERSDNKRKKYFKALPIEEISDEQLMVAERREVAQARLEGFILCTTIAGYLEWEEDRFGKWFYQSKGDPDLIILRIWIENK